MSRWKSRWSWLRLVKTSAAKRTRSSRPSAEPCEVASIAQLRSPASSISRNSRWRSIASAVVRVAGRRSPSTRRLDRPEQPRPPAGGGEHRVEQEGGRRLPARAGHPGDLQLLGRPAEELVGGHRHRRARVRDDELRHGRARAAARRRARPRRSRPPPAAKSCPSARCPDAEEERPRPGRAGVVGQVANLRGRRARRPPPARARRSGAPGPRRASLTAACRGRPGAAIVTEVASNAGLFANRTLAARPPRPRL